MIEKLLQMSEGKLLLPLIVMVVGVTLIKGAFSLTRSRSADRRDFLELFKKYESESDLWLSVAVRHLFGAYLPASLIRQLMSGPQPGRALLEVSNSWDLLDMHDETGELYWRKKMFGSAKNRIFTARLLSVLYFVLAPVSLLLAYLSFIGAFDGMMLVTAWTYAILCALVAFGCLAYGDTLTGADKAARRWLGMS